MKKLFRLLFPLKEMRAYRKLHCRHKRELMKLTKSNRDFDWGWLDEFVRLKIKHMYEYYTEGNNVWQCEDSLNVLIAQLKHVLDLYDELDHLWDTYESNLVFNADGSVTVDDTGSKKYLAVLDRETELYCEIYAYIGKYIQNWWD